MIKLTKQKQKSKDFTTKNKKYCNEMSIILVWKTAIWTRNIL